MNNDFRSGVFRRSRVVGAPVQEERVLLLDALVSPSLQCRSLRVPDAGFDFAFLIGMIRPTWQRDHAVVFEQRRKEWVELRGRKRQCRRSAAEMSECFFVQLAPNLLR